MQRYSERCVKDCDGDWFSTGMKEDVKGEWIRFSKTHENNIKKLAEYYLEGHQDIGTITGINCTCDGCEIAKELLNQI